MMARLSLPVILLACLVVTAVLYAPTFGYDWTYDDYMVIVDNPDVLSFGNFLQNSYPDRPLRELTYLLDHALFGLEPAGWRVQHLFWHALCGALLFALCRRLTGEVRVALGAALLFLVHPLQVEVVANLSHRKDSLVLAFCLLALLAWARSFAGARAGWWRLGAVLAWGVALLAKQNAIVVPLLALLYEWQFVAPERRFLLRLPGARLVYPLGIAAAAVAWCWRQGGVGYYRTYVGHLLSKLEYFGPAEIDTYLRAMVKSWAFMAVRLVWPADLAVEYVFPVPASWGDPWAVAGIASLLVLVGLPLWGVLRRRPQVAFWGGWLCAFWLPTSNLWPINYFAADRYLYPFVAGVAVLAALALHRLLRRAAAYAAVVVGLALLLAALAWQQSGYWRDDETLHRRALAVSPQSSFINNELGKIAEKRGDVTTALQAYRDALARDPDNAAAHYNIGRLYERAGLLPLAVEHYRAFFSHDIPAYREAAGELEKRLRRDYGLDLRREP